jgi:hypothetical protein
VGDARALAEVVPDLLGRADLVCTSPPYPADVGVLDRAAWGAGGGLCPGRARNYSADRANLGHARGRPYHDAMALVYAGCAGLVRPGGMFVVVTKHTRRDGRALDLAGLSVELGRAAGLAYVGHVIALHAAVRDGALFARPSFWQLVKARRLRAGGEPVHLPVHEDVVIFRQGEVADAG